ncbi:hypothetical protein H5410_037598 [Solanum commersonii]|uniref:Uncharacterized protein n=1 Tax=Solanum commersonii TaxID=4109 RepID=A0A9J5YBM2_SOLCO|nr:hypothetical protein H5410_037598 [Solanum commersonii]
MDYGWGGPTRVCLGSVPINKKIFLMDSQNEDGIEVLAINPISWAPSDENTSLHGGPVPFAPSVAVPLHVPDGNSPKKPRLMERVLVEQLGAIVDQQILSSLLNVSVNELPLMNQDEYLMYKELLPPLVLRNAAPALLLADSVIASVEAAIKEPESHFGGFEEFIHGRI